MGTNLAYRHVQEHYERLERDFSKMYLNPGTNASDKQELTPLQILLKKSAVSKELALERSKKTAKEKEAKKKQLGDLETQYRMRGPSPTKFDHASATSDDEIEIRTVRGASQREFQRLSSEKVEREFKRLSPEEVAQLTPEEKGEYDRQAHFMREMEDLDQDDDTGASALRVRYDNDNRGSKRRRVSTPSGEDALLEIVEQMKKAARGGECARRCPGRGTPKRARRRQKRE